MLIRWLVAVALMVLQPGCLASPTRVTTTRDPASDLPAVDADVYVKERPGPLQFVD